MSQELPNLGLARAISEAAFDPAKWVDVCDGMARLVGGCGSLIFPSDRDQLHLGLPRSAALEDSFSRYVAGEWYKRDLRYATVPVLRRRGWATDADCIAYDQVARSEYYQDFLMPVGLGWYTGIEFKSDQNFWNVSIQRELGKDPFLEADINKVLAYRSLLDNSSTIARHLGFARTLGASSALEQHGLCAIALDSSERVVHVSPSAEHHLKEGLQVCGGRLHAKRPAEAAALTRLIRAICGKDASASRLHVSLARSEGRRPLVLYGCALPAAECDVFQPAIALLVIADPDRPQDIPASLLMDYFGLTRSEVGLAAALMHGTSIDQHAADHGISPVTARNHLQALLRKTSTHRQADLIAILNKVVPRK